MGIVHVQRLGSQDSRNGSGSEEWFLLDLAPKSARAGAPHSLSGSDVHHDWKPEPGARSPKAPSSQGNAQGSQQQAKQIEGLKNQASQLTPELRRASYRSSSAATTDKPRSRSRSRGGRTIKAQGKGSKQGSGGAGSLATSRRKDQNKFMTETDDQEICFKYHSKACTGSHRLHVCARCGRNAPYV